MNNRQPADRSFIIPVLDFSPHSPYNINTLLDDLEKIPGEVICIFNSREVFEALGEHPRIDKYCFNNLNAGVSRSWNMGLNMAEGKAAFILNADMHIEQTAVEKMEAYLFNLDQAVIVGPQGAFVDFQQMRDLKYFEKGKAEHPVRCHAVSGFFFAIHLERFLSQKLSFDIQYSPCFTEEWDMGLQIFQAGLACYVVPVTEYDHHWGVSAGDGNQPINYFGREMTRNQILLANREKFKKKWHPLLGPAEDHTKVSFKPKEKSTFQNIPVTGLTRFVEFVNKVQNQSYAEALSQTHSQVTETMLPQILSKYAIPPDGTVLDVGCGQGPALSWLTEHGYRAIGVTINEEDLGICKSKGFEVYGMDQSFLDFPDKSFDLLWVRHCIEHSIFPFYTLSEFYRVLKSGAVLYLEVPIPDTPCRHEGNGNHYSVLTNGMWMSLVQRTGFLNITRADITVPLPVGTDTYWAFICQKPPLAEVVRQVPKSQQQGISGQA
jgi:SAM-dependent methyltransferase/GT2 family glycosyltransferase